MKKRSLGVMLVLAVVLVLSFAVVASASAAPYLTSVSPTSKANDNPGSFQLKIYGQNLTDLMNFDTNSVYLEQQSWPYDMMYASGAQIVSQLGGDYISCYVNSYQESPGSYDVVVSDVWWLFGQAPQNLRLSGAFTVTAGTVPSTPTIASVSPKSAVAGGPGFTLTVNGANFGTSPTVYWNSTALVTTPGGLPNPTATCSAIVPASYIANAGTAIITVATAIPGGSQYSNAVSFSITAAQPTLTGLNPAQTWARYITPPAVALNGTNFQNNVTQVLVNGAVHAATYVSPTQMSCQLTAADIANPGTLNFSVRNGATGTPSGTIPFTINAETTVPTVTISGADDQWHNSPVTLTVNAQDSQSGVQKVMYMIAAMPFTVLNGNTITVPGPQGGETNGVNNIQVYALDNCGQQGATASATVNICTTGPETEAFVPASVKKGKTLKISYDAQSITPTSNFQLKIYKSNGSVAKSFKIGQKNNNKTYTYSFKCNLAAGKYKVKTFATDAAGNKQSSQSADSFQVTK